MKFKQRMIVLAIIAITGLIGGTIMFIWNMPPNWPTRLLISTVFLSGLFIGMLDQRWKRNKEMAHIVADRLLGKKDNSSSFDQFGAAAPMVQQAMSGLANAASSLGIAERAEFKNWYNSVLGDSGVSGLGKR